MPPLLPWPRRPARRWPAGWSERSLGSGPSPSACTSGDTSRSAAPPDPCGPRGARCGPRAPGCLAGSKPGDPAEEKGRREVQGDVKGINWASLLDRSSNRKKDFSSVVSAAGSIAEARLHSRLRVCTATDSTKAKRIKPWLIQQGGHSLRSTFWESGVSELCAWLPKPCVSNRCAGRRMNKAPLTLWPSDNPLCFPTLTIGEHRYHLSVEAAVGQLSNEGQPAGTRLLHKVLLHSLHGLQVVLQQTAQHTHTHTHTHVKNTTLVSGKRLNVVFTWNTSSSAFVKCQL